MNLEIERGQEHTTDRKGNPERVTYRFSCRLHLDESERQLVQAYGQSRYPVAFLMPDDVRDYRPRNDDDRSLSVERLADGWSIESNFAGDLQAVEATLREGCKEFKSVLRMMESYGGHETVEI